MDSKFTLTRIRSRTFLAVIVLKNDDMKSRSLNFTFSFPYHLLVILICVFSKFESILTFCCPPSKILCYKKFILIPSINLWWEFVLWVSLTKFSFPIKLFKVKATTVQATLSNIQSHTFKTCEFGLEVL